MVFVIILQFGTLRNVYVLDNGVAFCNDARQEGVLSPKLFFVYVEDLSTNFNNCKVSGHIDDKCFNVVVHAQSPGSWSTLNTD